LNLYAFYTLPIFPKSKSPHNKSGYRKYPLYFDYAFVWRNYLLINCN